MFSESVIYRKEYTVALVHITFELLVYSSYKSAHIFALILTTSSLYMILSNDFFKSNQTNILHLGSTIKIYHRIEHGPLSFKNKNVKVYFWRRKLMNRYYTSFIRITQDITTFQLTCAVLGTRTFSCSGPCIDRRFLQTVRIWVTRSEPVFQTRLSKTTNLGKGLGHPI